MGVGSVVDRVLQGEVCTEYSPTDYAGRSTMAWVAEEWAVWLAEVCFENCTML